MMRSHPLHRLPGFTLALGMWGVAALVLLAAISVVSAQNPAPPKNEEALSSPPAAKDRATLTAPNQKGEPKKSSLEKTRNDAAELSALADQLLQEVNKANAQVLSLDIIQKTEKVEKLAKKIKGEANGH